MVEEVAVPVDRIDGNVEEVLRMTIVFAVVQSTLVALNTINTEHLGEALDLL